MNGNGIFTEPWSPLITNGLGTSACCGLLLGGLGVFKCFGGITPPPSGGGGGGSYAVHPSIYVPWPYARKRKPGKRAIVITVKIKERSWVHTYLVGEKAVPAAIRVLNFINKTSAALQVGVERVQLAVKRVRAMFNGE